MLVAEEMVVVGGRAGRGARGVAARAVEATVGPQAGVEEVSAATVVVVRAEEREVLRAAAERAGVGKGGRRVASLASRRSPGRASPQWLCRGRRRRRRVS